MRPRSRPIPVRLGRGCVPSDRYPRARITRDAGIPTLPLAGISAIPRHTRSSVASIHRLPAGNAYRPAPSRLLSTLPSIPTKTFPLTRSRDSKSPSSAANGRPSTILARPHAQWSDTGSVQSTTRPSGEHRSRTIQRPSAMRNSALTRKNPNAGIAHQGNTIQVCNSQSDQKHAVGSPVLRPFRPAADDSSH